MSKVCRLCGFSADKAIHQPPYGAPAGSEPWGHVFIPVGPEGDVAIGLVAGYDAGTDATEQP